MNHEDIFLFFGREITLSAILWEIRLSQSSLSTFWFSLIQFKHCNTRLSSLLLRTLSVLLVFIFQILFGTDFVMISVKMLKNHVLGDMRIILNDFQRLTFQSMFYILPNSIFFKRVALWPKGGIIPAFHFFALAYGVTLSIPLDDA